ncbi:hypothetical protein KIN20_003338 [Parelaphostrongylus tenuis]|uniref:Cysteine-rich DPF motif domain-containing protein 1 n=1 Tax=Parelaphostrongylus tenuis TaxID=148309 RepID=A0AAD5LWK5_PARTN|nr:hypothetical protein KIN20_003338 [Parelaphostrongylus tenuis]
MQPANDGIPSARSVPPKSSPSTNAPVDDKRTDPGGVPCLLVEDNDADLEKLDPYLQFQCSICFLNEKCLFGDLKASDGFYPTPVFYMRDPFEPPQRVKGRKPLLSDFLVIGSSCSLCHQSVCLDKACSIYFGAVFCTTCVTRERRRFPDKVLQVVTKAQSIAGKPNKPTSSSVS